MANATQAIGDIVCVRQYRGWEAIEAGAAVRAVAERVGVSHVTVEADGQDFRFGFRLEGLAEAQALAVLAIAEGASPEAVALIDSYREVGRRIGTPGQVELIDSYRAQVDARLAREREDGGQ